MVRELSDGEKTLVHRMRGVIERRRKRNMERSNFLEAEYRLKMSGYDIPPEFDKFRTVLNWPQKAVTAFAARQIPTGFSTRVQSSLLDDIEALYEDANFGPRERMVIESADEFGVSFVFTTLGDEDAGEPPVVFSPRTALTATCELDRRSGAVTAALEQVSATALNLYLPGLVLECERPESKWLVAREVPMPTRRVMCAPYVHGATLRKPFGRSRITRPVMDLTMAGCRTLLRQEVSAQFYMAPRLAALGVSPEDFGEKSPWSILVGDIWAIPDVSMEDEPTLPDSLRRAQFESFQQLSMQPFSDQYRLLAAALSGEASIPPNYLGVVSDSNPTSAAAIEAQEVDLVREVNAQNPILGMGRRTVALNALALLHGNLDPDDWAELRGLHPDWEDPRTRSMSEQSQMAALQVQAGNLQPGTKTTLKQLPMSAEDVSAAVEDNRRAAGTGILDQALAAQEGADEADDLLARSRTFRELRLAGVTADSAAAIAGLGDVVVDPNYVPSTGRSREN